MLTKQSTAAPTPEQPRLIIPTTSMPTAPNCPCCKGQHYAVYDDGDPESFQARSWCGMRARVQRDDPEINRMLASAQLPGYPAR